MAPSLTWWVIEKGLVVQLRRRCSRELTTRVHEQSTPRVIAELCLRRTLTLEREARNVSLIRRREALASLARSAIEATLIGIYALSVGDEQMVRRFETQGGKHLSRTLKPWLPAKPNLRAFVDATLDEDGGRLTDKAGMPDLRHVALAVDEHWPLEGEPVALRIYEEFYLPLSNFSAHTSIGSLARYYTFRSRRVISRPWGIVPRRGVIRVINGCTALLAGNLAQEARHSPEW